VERARRFVVVVLAGAIAFAGVMLITRWSMQVGPSWLRAGATSFVLPWLALLALAALWWPDARVRWRPRSRAWRSWAALAAVLIAVVGVSWLYAGMLARIFSHGATAPNVTMAVVSGVVLGPIAEEWIFRGILWRQLVPGESAPPLVVLLAVVATSALFAVWHLPFNPDAPLLAHGIFGALMATMRWQTGGLLPCVVLHGAANLLYFLQPR
jgi:membrane protease YdiL (CAAX protease family)